MLCIFFLCFYGCWGCFQKDTIRRREINASRDFKRKNPSDLVTVGKHWRKSHLLENHKFGNFISAYFTALPKAPGSIKEKRKRRLHWMWSERELWSPQQGCSGKRNCKKNISLLLVQIWLPDGLLHFNENVKPCTSFPFQLMDGEHCSIRRYTFVLPFSLSTCFTGCFISTTYHRPMMKAAFQLFLEWFVFSHRERAKEECLFQERRNGICQWCKPDRKGRKETLVFHERVQKHWTVSPDRFSQQLRSSACNLVIWSLITELIGRTRGLCGAVRFSVLWQYWQTQRVSSGRVRKPLSWEDLWPGLALCMVKPSTCTKLNFSTQAWEMVVSFLNQSNLRTQN